MDVLSGAESPRVFSNPANAWMFAFRVARKRFRLAREDAEDVAQEVLLLMARRPPAQPVTPAWIANGVLFRCVDRARRRASEARALAVYAEEQELVRRREALRDVSRRVEIASAIETLPKPCRELLWKHYVEQKTWAEIDAELGTRRCAQYRASCCIRALAERLRQRDA